MGRNKAKPRIGRPILPTALAPIIISLITISSPLFTTNTLPHYNFSFCSSHPLLSCSFPEHIFIQVYAHLSFLPSHSTSASQLSLFILSHIPIPPLVVPFVLPLLFLCIVNGDTLIQYTSRRGEFFLPTPCSYFLQACFGLEEAYLHLPQTSLQCSNTLDLSFFLPCVFFPPSEDRENLQAGGFHHV